MIGRGLGSDMGMAGAQLETNPGYNATATEKSYRKAVELIVQRVENGWLIAAVAGNGGRREFWVAKTKAELMVLLDHLAEEHEEREVHVG